MPDFGCYITLTNNLGVPLKLTNSHVDDGYWVSGPPSSIAATSDPIVIHLSDNVGFYGSAGSFTYVATIYGGQKDVTVNMALRFACPTGSSNTWQQDCTRPELVKITSSGFQPDGHPLRMTVSFDPSNAFPKEGEHGADKFLDLIDHMKKAAGIKDEVTGADK